MPTMLQALLDEAHKIADLDVQIERLIFARGDALEKLIRQLATVADEQALAATVADVPTISANDSEAAFREFQAVYFPFKALSEAAPAILPATRDDGQGNQGSGEEVAGAKAPLLSGGAVVEAEPEQVVAEAAPEESAGAGDDPGVVPDSEEPLGPYVKSNVHEVPADSVEDGVDNGDLHAKRERALDLYASESGGLRYLASKVPCAFATFQNYLLQGRRNSDRRVAAGDLLRVSKEGGRPGLAKVALEDATLPEEVKQAPPGETALIELDKRVISFDGNWIVVGRHQIRMLQRVNNPNLPATLEEMLHAAGVMTRARLDSEVKKLNDLIRQIGLRVLYAESGWTMVPGA